MQERGGTREKGVLVAKTHHFHSSAFKIFVSMKKEFTLLTPSMAKKRMAAQEKRGKRRERG